MAQNLVQSLARIWNIDDFVMDYPVGQKSFMKTGGNADIFFQPKSISHMAKFLKTVDEDEDCREQVCVLGAMSNILIRDGGVRGIVLNLDHILPKENAFRIENTQLICSAGAYNYEACYVAANAGLSGMEFLIGIPGSIGGAVYMNAGAQGSEIKDILEWADLMKLDGTLQRVSKDALKMTYRNGGISRDSVIVQACFNLVESDKSKVTALQMEYLKERNAKIKIPKTVGTAGSVFKNPPGEKAWKLIDEVGARGMRLGGAMVSDQHTNFLLNVDHATATELEDLGENIRNLVYKKRGLLLEWEMKILGERCEPEELYGKHS